LENPKCIVCGVEIVINNIHQKRKKYCGFACATGSKNYKKTTPRQVRVK